MDVVATERGFIRFLKGALEVHAADVNRYQADDAYIT